MRTIIYRKNVSVRMDITLYDTINEFAIDNGLTISNAIENLCKDSLGLPVDKKPTKRGRKTNN